MKRAGSEAAIAVFAGLALCATLYYTAALFATLNTTLSDYSWGDVIWINQAFWNFTHGRALQTSLYAHSGAGVLLNPFSYSSQLAMHVNWFPYLFSPLYRLAPNINGLYAIVLLWNFLGIGFFLTKIVSFLSPDRLGARRLLPLGLLLSGTLFPIVAYKGLFLLFAGPLIPALFFFLIARQKWAFLVTGVLLCLVSEDCALLALSFCAYAFLFHEREREYVYPLLAFAAAYLALVMFVIMPATKYDLVMASRDASDIAIRLKNMLAGQYPLELRGFAPIIAFLIAGFGMLAAFFPPSARTNWRRLAGLVLLAPASHWIITLFQGTGHHPLPIMALSLAAMAYYAGTADFAPRVTPRSAGALLLGLLLLASNFFWLRRRLVSPLAYPRLAAGPQALSNKALLISAAGLPEDASVTYWTNRGLDGFLSSRCDAWRFPKNFDKSDYLLVQKDSDEAFFEIMPPFSKDVSRVINGGVGRDLGKTGPNRRAAEWLKRMLVVEARTHSVALENDHFLFLKRKELFKIPMPAFSLGFGWARNIQKLRTRKAP